MSTSSRSPAFDLAFTTRVLSVTGMESEPGYNKWYGVDRNPGTGTMVAEFDCPADAWFLEGASRGDLMPYSILMEIALQTCGILTSWNKARRARTPSVTAPAHAPRCCSARAALRAPLSHLRRASPSVPHPRRPARRRSRCQRSAASTCSSATWTRRRRCCARVELRGQTIVRHVSTCTGYSHARPDGRAEVPHRALGGRRALLRGGLLLRLVPPRRLREAGGLDGGKKRDCWHVGAGHALDSFALPADEARIFAPLRGPHRLSRRSGQARYLDGVGLSKTGGKHGHGYGHGFKTVDKRDWFFSCHFWCAGHRE